MKKIEEKHLYKRDSELKKGMEVEKEHDDVTGGDKKKTKKIAEAHLKEKPDYYSRLEKVEGKEVKGKEKKEKNWNKR